MTLFGSSRTECRGGHTDRFLTNLAVTNSQLSFRAEGKLSKKGKEIQMVVVVSVNVVAEADAPIGACTLVLLS